MTIMVLGDTTLHQRIKATQEYNKDVSTTLESILKNGPRSLTKGLEDWNLEDGIILYRGQVYIPKNESLWRDIVKKYHDHVAKGHPGRWKTYEVLSREFWWPGMSTIMWMDAPHAKPWKLDQETKYLYNLTKFPLTSGRLSPWTLSWISPCPKDTTHYLWL